MPYLGKVDLGLRYRDRRQRERPKRAQSSVEIVEGVLQPGSLGLQRGDLARINLCEQGSLGLPLPFAPRLRHPPIEAAVEVVVEGALDDLAQVVGP